MIYHFLSLKHAGFPQSLSDILRHDWGIEPIRLNNLVAKGGCFSETDYLMQSILDSSIDVDKVSYLIYDSYYSGPRYGLGIDLDGFLAALVAIPANEERHRHAQIGVSATGIVPAEGIISARYAMFSRVYWHHFNRAIIAMLSYAASRIFLSNKNPYSFNQYIKATVGFSDMDAVRLFENRLKDVIKNEPSRPTSNLLTGLVNGTRDVYKRLLTFSARPGSTKAAIHNYLISLGFPQLEDLRRQLIREISKIIKATLKDSDVLFDIPRAEKTSDNMKPLFVFDEEAEQPYEEIKYLSRVIESLSVEFEHITKKSRIFMSPELDELLIKDRNKANAVKKETEKFLLSKVKPK
jgi:HD superfamily phosphohydrolase